MIRTTTTAIPAIDLGAIVGDSFGGRRGALDNDVWALTVTDFDPAANLLPTGGNARKLVLPNWRRVAFPAVTPEDAWPR